MHSKKSKTWIINRYYKPDIAGQSKNKWILTDPKKNKQLTKMSWIPIVRHRIIKFRATPYDSSLKGYFSSRDEKEFNRNCVKTNRKWLKYRIINALYAIRALQILQKGWKYKKRCQ